MSGQDAENFSGATQARAVVMVPSTDKEQTVPKLSLRHRFAGSLVRPWWTAFVLLALTVSCKASRITGTIVDNFGHPVAGASIEVTGTGFRATSDGAGHFSLDYAPGSFAVAASAVGHVNAEVAVNVAQKVAYPLSNIVLIRVPRAEGVHVRGPADYVDVPAQPLPETQRLLNATWNARCFDRQPPARRAVVVSDGDFLAFAPTASRLQLVTPRDGLLSSRPTGLMARCRPFNPALFNLDTVDLTGGLRMYRGRLSPGTYCFASVAVGRDISWVGDEGFCFDLAPVCGARGATCEACATLPGCGWCGATGRCLNLTDSSGSAPAACASGWAGSPAECSAPRPAAPAPAPTPAREQGAVPTPGPVPAPAQGLVPTPSPAPPQEQRSDAAPLVPDRFAASSEFHTRREQHPAAHAFDGRPETAWNDGVSGDGTGQWIEAGFAQPVQITEVRFSPGWDYVSPRSGDLFPANSHIRRADLLVDGRLIRSVDIGADQRSVTVTGLDVRGSSLRIVAATVWDGRRFHDMSISEVQLVGRRPASAPAAPSAPAATTQACETVVEESFHLRPVETRASTGARYPANTRVAVLERGRLLRSGLEIFRVRVVADGAVGWVFLTNGDLDLCPQYQSHSERESD